MWSTRWRWGRSSTHSRDVRLSARSSGGMCVGEDLFVLFDCLFVCLLVFVGICLFADEQVNMGVSMCMFW